MENKVLMKKLVNSHLKNATNQYQFFDKKVYSEEFLECYIRELLCRDPNPKLPISFYAKQHLTISFVSEFENLWNWRYITIYQKKDQKFVDFYSDKMVRKIF